MSLSANTGESALNMDSPMASQQLVVQVRGRVQGVGFRYFVRTAAKRLQICGWVRNESNGCVSVVAEGPRPQLMLLVRALRVGPSLATVQDVQYSWHEATGAFEGFTIL